MCLTQQGKAALFALQQYIKVVGLTVLAHGEPVNPESLKAAQVRFREVGILAVYGGEQSN